MRVVVVVVLVQTALHLLTIGRSDLYWLNVNNEFTVPSLVAGLTIAATAVGCRAAAVSGVVERRFATPLFWILVFFALDELLSIHERVGGRGAALVGLSNDWDSMLWPVFYLPLLGLVFVGLLRFSGSAPPAAARLIRTGLGLLVLAVVLEVLSAPFSTRETAAGLVHALEGAVERRSSSRGGACWPSRSCPGRPSGARRCGAGTRPVTRSSRSPGTTVEDGEHVARA